MSQYRAPSIFETYNARHLSPESVAETFVPPDQIFDRLATLNNHIVVGPRGSGKTTLLKMLTLPALLSWSVEDTPDVLPKVDFIGIFVAADRAWRSQIGAARGVESSGVTVGSIAFTTHVLNSLVRTIDAMSMFGTGNRAALSMEPKPLEDKQESDFAKLVAEQWQLNLTLHNLDGLKLSLRARLAHLKSLIPLARRSADPEGLLIERAPYATLDYRENLKYAVETFEILTKNAGLKWALLFDEFELAPDEIQHDVLSYLRGEEKGSLVYKLALAPFNQNFMKAISESDSSKKNDYEVIDLWYPRKNEARSFSERLFFKNLKERGLPLEEPETALGRSEFDFREKDEDSPYSEDGQVFRAVQQLRKIDPSFDAFLKKREIDLRDWDSMDENDRAQIRKWRSIVVIRNYFRSKTQRVPSGRTIERASRKVHTIYTGAPTLLALCEGNPRTLIGLLSPLLRQLQIERQSSRKRTVDKNLQARQVKESVSAFRALLKTISQDQATDRGGRSLLRLLDEVGEYFHDECVRGPFQPQPHMSFTVPSNADDGLQEIIGRALNMGAIIYVPDQDADPILTSIKGKRFRLCYLLAAYYKLPIMINTPVSLKTLLEKYSRGARNAPGLGQVDLFEEYGSEDD